ncbi:hypothetical protein SEA_HARAMBE_68 [Gordonia phage Harambe]|uniref:Uncharacterized protein n=1 Tax=Gordonia phage Harambe TaxID=2510575 RepID=A0A411B2W1_9CAUD|nr:hypothetical protein SEA_HARAMBE_68 [Gordonia phage Harambe]
MSVIGLKKALAQLEEPLFKPEEEGHYRNLSDMANYLTVHGGFYSSKVSMTSGKFPIVDSRGLSAVADGEITIWRDDTKAQGVLFNVPITAVNRVYGTFMYPRSFGEAGAVAVYRFEIAGERITDPNFVADTPNPTDCVIADTLMAAIISEAYFDWPIAYTLNDDSDVVWHYARFRAKFEEDTNTYKVIGLCRPFFLDPEPPSAPIRVVDTIALNIGEFPSDYRLQPETLVCAYMAALDGVIDLGIGFDYDCHWCNVSYSALDPTSSDRAVLSVVGGCRTCVLGERPSFDDDILPQPF